ncbi:MAG: hypothetical protein IMZ52_02350 [Actinobacteria bacterium]|nr:hypothetical protein [Actinomycetota bacterium]MBE3114864.1 hypothetical protein [Actinomycetota bacterium]
MKIKKSDRYNESIIWNMIKPELEHYFNENKIKYALKDTSIYKSGNDLAWAEAGWIDCDKLEIGLHHKIFSGKDFLSLMKRFVYKLEKKYKNMKWTIIEDYMHEDTKAANKYNWKMFSKVHNDNVKINKWDWL